MTNIDIYVVAISFCVTLAVFGLYWKEVLRRDDLKRQIKAEQLRHQDAIANRKGLMDCVDGALSAQRTAEALAASRTEERNALVLRNADLGSQYERVDKLNWELENKLADVEERANNWQEETHAQQRIAKELREALASAERECDDLRRAKMDYALRYTSAYTSAQEHAAQVEAQKLEIGRLNAELRQLRKLTAPFDGSGNGDEAPGGFVSAHLLTSDPPKPMYVTTAVNTPRLVAADTAPTLATSSTTQITSTGNLGPGVAEPTATFHVSKNGRTKRGRKPKA